jgi:UDP-glucose 4-epimerase
MKVLVTGGSGFLGAWIVRRLVRSNHQIRIFDIAANKSLVAEIAGAGADTVEWQTGDIVDPDHVHGASEGCDAIVHLAGILTPDCRTDPIRGAQINLIGTLNVFETARKRGIRQIVYTSSAGVFGPTDGHTPCPDTHYGAFKLACEGSARAYWEDHRLGSFGFRPYVVYGPGRTTGLTAGPSLACRAAAKGEPYSIPYSGSAGLIYVDDVAAAYEAALLHEPDGAHVFNMPVKSLRTTRSSPRFVASCPTPGSTSSAPLCSSHPISNAARSTPFCPACTAPNSAKAFARPLRFTVRRSHRERH